MTKLKTNKATRKRFKVTATGKVLFRKTKRRHLLGDRSRAKKRQFKRARVLDDTNVVGVIRALPYGGQ